MNVEVPLLTSKFVVNLAAWMSKEFLKESLNRAPLRTPKWKF